MSNLLTTHSGDNKRDMAYEPGADMPTGFIAVVEGVSGKEYKAQMQQIDVERYQYVGMTEAAAKACADAENALSSSSEFGSSISYVAQAARQADSRMWNTNVVKTTIAMTWKDAFTSG